MDFLNNVVLNKEHPFTRCYMLEQPFSAHLTPQEFEEWKAVRQEYSKHGILIFADESIHNATQVEELGVCGIYVVSTSNLMDFIRI